jgi:4-amino-4-deoxy-L-arabinose transferase-like glycosyltransferase
MVVTTPDPERIDRRTFRLLYASVVIFAGVLRVAYVVGAKRNDLVVGDQIYYSAQANMIARGRWFAFPYDHGQFAANHAPITSLLLVPASWMDENVLLAQRLLMAVYGMLVVAGIGLLARWLFNRAIALVASLIAAVYANLWMNDALVMSETFAAGAVVAVLFAVYVYDLRRCAWSALALGVVLGLAGLTRAELLLLGPLVVLPLMLIPRDPTRWPIRWRHLCIAGGVCVIVLSPWLVRNHVRFEDTTLISTQDGLTLLGANCPGSYFGPGKGFWDLRCADLIDVPEGADQSQRSALYREYAFDFIAENRSELPGVIAARLGRGFSVWQVEQMIQWNTGEGREMWASRIGHWQYWVLAPLAVWGLWRWPSRQPRWPLLATAGLSVITIMAFYGIPRFRIPAEVAIVLGAAVTVEALISWLAARLAARRSVRGGGNGEVACKRDSVGANTR